MLSGPFLQCRCPGVIDVIREGPVLDPLNGFIHHEQRNQDPFARHHRLGETVLDLDVEPVGFEDQVDQVFQLSCSFQIKLLQLEPNICNMVELKRKLQGGSGCLADRDTCLYGFP